MTITNSQLKRTAMQVFASSHGYETPFYNRERSKKEIKTKFKNIEDLKSTAYIISAPLGTGKTFFIDTVKSELGIDLRSKPLLFRELNKKELKSVKDDILFIDEGDIKTTWDYLKKGAGLIQEHIAKTGQTALLIGDYSLKNPKLSGILENKEYLHSFEPLNKEFLNGVMKQRLTRYLMLKKEEDIIDEELYDILVPDELAPVSSFRTVLSFLERIVRLLPSNSKPCRLTLDLAKEWVQQDYDPMVDTDEQENFLNILLDYLTENNKKGAGLANGFTEDGLFTMGRDAGYESIEVFRESIIEPFTRNEVLISTGIPYCNEDGEFIRRPEPFYPSIPLLLYAEL